MGKGVAVMLMINKADYPITLDWLGVVVQPGGQVDVEDGYCLPRRASNGSRIPPIIETIAWGLVPYEESLARACAQTPETTELYSPPVPEVTASDLVAKGMAPGVADLVIAERESGKKPKRGKRA